MSKFSVVIVETSSRMVEIEAADKAEAEDTISALPISRTSPAHPIESATRIWRTLY